MDGEAFASRALPFIYLFFADLALCASCGSSIRRYTLTGTFGMGPFF